MIDSKQLRSIAGKHLVGADGEKIGKIADVYESTDGGGGTFATVTTGLFGGGSSFFPLEAADLRGDEVVVPYTKEFIKDAPRVENDEELTAPEEQRLFQYYESSAGAAQALSRGTDRRDVDGDGVHDGVQDTAVRRDTSGFTTDDAMTPSEERLHVGTEKVEPGQARLRRHVVTDTETVPVTREEVRVEREPIDAPSMPKAMDGPDTSADGRRS